jgi:hypothetical protein
MPAKGTSRGSLTCLSVARPIVAVVAAAKKLAVGEKHTLALPRPRVARDRSTQFDVDGRGSQRIAVS